MSKKYIPFSLLKEPYSLVNEPPNEQEGPTNPYGADIVGLDTLPCDNQFYPYRVESMYGEHSRCSSWHIEFLDFVPYLFSDQIGTYQSITWQPVSNSCILRIKKTHSLLFRGPQRILISTHAFFWQNNQTVTIYLSKLITVSDQCTMRTRQLPPEMPRVWRGFVFNDLLTG